jgi:hypothetical protein
VASDRSDIVSNTENLMLDEPAFTTSMGSRIVVIRFAGPFPFAAFAGSYAAFAAMR